MAQELLRFRHENICIAMTCVYIVYPKDEARHPAVSRIMTGIVYKKFLIALSRLCKLLQRHGAGPRPVSDMSASDTIGKIERYFNVREVVFDLAVAYVTVNLFLGLAALAYCVYSVVRGGSI